MANNNGRKTFLISLGVRIKQMRERSNITQAQLAVDCDVDVSLISRIERGAINTSIYNVKLIAEALHIEVQDLLRFE